MQMQTRFLRLLTISLILMLPTGCYHNDKNDLTEEESLVVKINLTVPNAATGTRAATEPGNAAENYIDVDGDYHVLIFDKAGVMADVVKMEECEITSEAGSLTTYTLSGKMTIPDEAARARLETFQMMVLANWKSFDESSVYPTFPPTYPEGGTVSRNDFYTKDAVPSGLIPNSLCFTMPQRSETAWQPGIDGQKHLIPMFGISDPISLDYAITMGKYGDSPITSISMLRSIAKVEIVDAMEGQDISGITLSRSNAVGRFIPNLDKDSPSLPQSAANENYISNLALFKAPYTRDYTDQSGETRTACPVYVAYIPEMELSSSSRPQFTLTTGSSTYTFDFDNYVDGDPVNTLEAVLRNHIYRYTVTENGVLLNISLSVEDWKMLWDDLPTHFDPPAVAPGGYISWVITVLDDPEDPNSERENGYKDLTNELRLIMDPSTDKFAECSFTLSSPVNAKWVAYLRPSCGAIDAFYFTTGEKKKNPDDGELLFEEGGDSGIINGEPIILKIACKRGIVFEENNEATLVIMVQYADKTQKEVIVVDPSKKPQTVIPVPYTNYTIVQEVTQIM